MAVARKLIAAFLTMGSLDPFTPERLVAEMRRRNAQVGEVQLIGSAHLPGRGFVLRIGSTAVAILCVDAPVPADALACALYADPSREKNAEAMKDHRAQVIVISLKAPSDIDEAMAYSFAVTQIAASISALSPSNGAIYWPLAEQINGRDKLLSDAGLMVHAKTPATELWTRIYMTGHSRFGAQPFSDDQFGEADVMIGGATIGSHSFTGYELVFEMSRVPLVTVLHRLRAALDDMLSTKNLFKDGERIRIKRIHEDEADWLQLTASDDAGRGGGPCLVLSCDYAATSLPRKNKQELTAGVLLAQLGNELHAQATPDGYVDYIRKLVGQISDLYDQERGDPTTSDVAEPHLIQNVNAFQDFLPTVLKPQPEGPLLA